MKILKILLVFILWIVEYFLIFGAGALLIFGRPLTEVSLLAFWIAFLLLICIATFTWRIIFKKKNN